MKGLVLLISALMVLFTPLFGQAAVFNVNSVAEFQQALIDATNNNEDDTINVAAGNYDVSGGTLTYRPESGGDFGSDNHALTIQGAGTGQTILDGGGRDRILFMDTQNLTNDSNAHITVKGMTFQYANGDSGCGVFVLSIGGNVTLTNNTFINNIAKNGGGGGAFASSKEGIVTITTNTFSYNTARFGGGVAGRSIGGNVILTNNTFTNNTSEDPIFSPSGGGAFADSEGGIITITNNTFTYNISELGGGAFVSLFENAAKVDIFNNIIWGNTGHRHKGEDLYVSINEDVLSFVKLFNNVLGLKADFDDPDNVDPFNNEDLIIGKGGLFTYGFNINEDPKLGNFTDDGRPGKGHFPLQSTSPAIDAGDDAVCSAYDQLGFPRVDGNNDGSVACDIGAVEHPEVVNDFVRFIRDSSSYETTTDTTGCVLDEIEQTNMYVGQFSFDAILRNRSNSPSPLSGLVVEVTELTNNNVLQNADGGPGGVGARLTIPNVGDYADRVLAPGESVNVHFVICLTEITPFRFFVDVFGFEEAGETDSLQVAEPHVTSAELKRLKFRKGSRAAGKKFFGRFRP